MRRRTTSSPRSSSSGRTGGSTPCSPAFPSRSPGRPGLGGTSWRATGFERSGPERDPDAGAHLAPRPRGRAGRSRWTLLPSLRPTGPHPPAPEPVARHLAGPSLPRRGGVGGRLHRMGATRPQPGRSPPAPRPHRPTVPRACAGPEVGDPARPGARHRRRAVPGARTAPKGDPGRLLAGLPVPRQGRGRAPTVRVPADSTSDAGLLRRTLLRHRGRLPVLRGRPTIDPPTRA